MTITSITTAADEAPMITVLLFFVLDVPFDERNCNEYRVKFGQRLFTTHPHVSLRSARILSLSEEGVYAETSEKFYLSSVLVTHLCL